MWTLYFMPFRKWTSLLSSNLGDYLSWVLNLSSKILIHKTWDSTETPTCTWELCDSCDLLRCITLSSFFNQITGKVLCVLTSLESVCLSRLPRNTSYHSSLPQSLRFHLMSLLQPAPEGHCSLKSVFSWHPLSAFPPD